jgi:hypothetical protein
VARAAILIGVSQSGTLDYLPAVRDGIRMMADWARTQQMDTVICLSDEDGNSVTAQAIKDAIRDIRAPRTVEQLVIYFAGHGIYQRSTEYWLLSGAPADADEAVNLHASIEAARRSGIPHIVLIADACRTTGSGIDTVDITGSTVFENLGESGARVRVDRIYAAERGYESLEVRAGENDRFHGVFSEVMSAVLSGANARMLERGEDGDEDSAYIRARVEHEDALGILVDRRLRELDVNRSVFQRPEVIFESGGKWISRVPWREPGGMPEEDGVWETYSGEVSAQGDLRDRVRAFLREELGLGSAMPGEDDVGALPPGTVHTVAEHELPSIDVVSPAAAVIVQGALIAGAWSTDVDLRLKNDFLVAPVVPAEGSSVLVELNGGTSVLVPLIAGFRTTLAVSDGDVRDLSITALGEHGDDDASRLRAILAGAARVGRIDARDDARTALLTRVVGSRPFDVVLALLVATVLADVDDIDNIALLDHAATERLGVSLFDLAMLRGRLDSTEASPPNVVPELPMLARSWATLGVRGIELAGGLASVETRLTTSIWTQFDERGTAIARAVFARH